MMQEFLLKLHYLGLEINSIYQLINTFRYYHYDFKRLGLVLNKHYSRYQMLDIKTINQELLKHKIGFKTILDEDYPKQLRDIYMPPLVLFYQGNYDLVNKPGYAVIGARKNSDYGKKACHYFVSGLVKSGYTVISGLAKGIDQIAHEATLLENGSTIAVLGSGIKRVYPTENQALACTIGKNHLLLSEYAPFEGPKKTHFPFRNRIVSGLSLGVIVIEAAMRSGTLITTDFALEQGKEVFVVPGDIFRETSEGTNHLIKQGAKLISEIADLI